MSICFLFLLGNCFRVVLDGAAGGESRQHYVPESTTVCFDCAAYKPMVGGSTSMSVLWLLDGDQVTNNERFSNGYVLSNGTLMITDSSSSFDFQQEATIGCANGLEDTTSVQQEVVNFNVLLGGEFFIIVRITHPAITPVMI